MNTKRIYEMTVMPVLALLILLVIIYVSLENSKPKHLPELICFPADKSFHVLEQTNDLVPAPEPQKFIIINHPFVCDDEHRDICHE